MWTTDICSQQDKFAGAKGTFSTTSLFITVGAGLGFQISPGNAQYPIPALTTVLRAPVEI